MGVNGLPRLTSVRACASTAIWLPPRPGWLAAIWKVRSAASAEGTKRELPALVDRCSTERCEAEPLHRAEGTTRAEGATASSWPSVAVIKATGASRPALLRSCQRPAPAELPGPPGFPRPPRGVLAILGTGPDSGTSALIIWKRWPMSGGQGCGCSSSAAGTLAAVWGLLADGGCGVGPLLKQLLLVGRAGPEPLARLASSWAVKAMPKNSAIPVRLAHSNRAMTPVSGP